MSDGIDFRERNLHLQAALNEARQENAKLQQRLIGRDRLVDHAAREVARIEKEAAEVHKRNEHLRREIAQLKGQTVVNQKLTLRDLCEQIAEIVGDDELDYSHIDQFREMQDKMRMKQGWTDCNVEANKQTLDFCRDVLDRRLI